jgi:tetratricopeptide (TPR) repeat protein
MASRDRHGTGTFRGKVVSILYISSAQEIALKTARLLLSIAVVVFFSCCAVAQSNGPDLRELTVKADDFASSGKYKEALELYEKVLSAEPDNEGALYNSGLSHFMTADFARARASWERLEKLDPDDWMVKAKLIQTYQALSELPSRDQKRAELIAFRKTGTSPELSKRDTYCREQGVMAGRKVMVLEHFDLKGERAVRYSFVVLNDKGEEDYSITLGSYDFDNSMWAERNKERAKAGVRLYHLDGYYRSAHATYGFYEGEPSYDDIRKVVIGVLEDKVKPLSMSRYPKK